MIAVAVVLLAMAGFWTKTDEQGIEHGPPGIIYMWRMDATSCGPYPVDPTQTVCKEQTVDTYPSEALCRADFAEKQKEGYTDISCERVAN